MQPPPASDECSILTPRALASTYNTPSQSTPWEAVKQYHRVMRAVSQNPNKGSAALAPQVDLPRSRIRTWVDNGGAPDVVRGLDTATRHGWFDDSPDVTRGWATLFAGILGGGSIATEHYRPQWTTSPGVSATRAEAALETLDVGHTIVDREGRPTQLQPGQDSAVLGRALVALGVTPGDKNTETVESLPQWLSNAERDVRREAVEILILYRGQAFADKDTIELFEQRSRSFRESVASLIGSVVDGEVSPGNRYVVISAQASRELGFDRSGPLRHAIE